MKQVGRQTHWRQSVGAALPTPQLGADSGGQAVTDASTAGDGSHDQRYLRIREALASGDGALIERLEEHVIIDLRHEPAVLLYRDTAVDLDDELPSRAERLKVRALDLAIAIPASIVLFPVVVVVAIIVGLTSKGPVFYKSNRQTRGGRWFEMMKFRTMVADADHVLEQYFSDNPDAKERFERHNKFRVDPRVTRVGQVLRKFSLDELPQLLNVIKGDMSVVGPRPQLDFEVERFGSARPTVQRVKGGMTGLWQVSGRSHLTFEERLALEVEYATTRSLKGDVSIIAKTAGQLVAGSPGAY